MAYAELAGLMHKILDLRAASALLGWDQETYMPDGAVDVRAEQMATLSSLIHMYSTNDEAVRAGENAANAQSEMSPLQRRVVAKFVEDQQRALRLPPEFVNELARVTSKGQDAWKKSRASNDFSIFKPHLEAIVRLKQQEAELTTDGGNLYDALLHEYEPGLTVEALEPVFNELRAGTVKILEAIGDKQSDVSDEILYRHYDADLQLKTAKKIITSLGFDNQTGRIDISAHPFCTSFSHTDVRLTTRIRENDLRSCLFGLIHEAGHGMYEQGVSPELDRTFGGGGASMGIHESQSLFWENTIARSEEFWSWAFPILKSSFPDQLNSISVRDFYKAINKMVPSLNRVESDELTYNLHIILRFELENDLINGRLSVADVPAAWNDKMQASLGVQPTTDADGCLQDVHWSFGGIGYFPSYSLGKLYAAMQWTSMQEAVPDVKNQIANGNFSEILAWLRTNIHTVGRTESPLEISTRACGKPLTAEDFLKYVGQKAQDVYS